MHPHRRRRLAAALVCAAAIAAIIAVGGAFSAGAQPARPPKLAHAPKARRASLDSPVISRFALLRAPAAAAPPDAVLHAVAHAPASYELDPGQARQAPNGAWLIPGGAGSCLAVHDDDGIGMSCAPNAEVEGGHLAFTVRDQKSGEEQITGVAPDGATSVTASNAEGESLTRARVLDNTYELGADNAAQLTIE